MPKPKSNHYRNNYEREKDNRDKSELEPCVAYVKKCWEDWDNHWGAKLTKFEDYYNRWIGVPPKREEDWQANFHKKLSWQAEKVLVSRYHSALFPTSAPIDTDATETVDEFQAILGKSIVGHWFKIGLVSKEFLSSMRSAAIYGTGLFEDEWLLKTEYVPEMIEEETPDYRPMVDVEGKPILDKDGNIRSMQIGTKKIKTEQNKLKIIEDRYRVIKANIFAWRIHPDKLSDDDDYPAIKQEFISYQTLEQRQNSSIKMGFGSFDNMDKIKDDVFKLDESSLKRLQKDSSGYEDVKNPRLELLHYWGYYNNSDDSDKENNNNLPMWITIVNRKFRLKKRLNPLWHRKPPLFHIIWTEDEKPSYYGIGICEVGASAEDRANDNVNKRTDIKSKSVKGTGWYNALDKKIKKSQLRQNSPGTMRACSDINNAYKPDIVQPLSPDDYREEDVAVNDHREITGSTTALLPPADKSQQPDTLGGMQINLQQALSRLKPDLVMMEMMGIRKIANRAFLLTRQFFKQPKMIELMASEDKLKQLSVSKIYRYTSEQITSNLNFICIGLTESVEKAQNIDKAMAFIDKTSKIPVAQQIINYREILKDILMWIGFQNSEKYFLPMAQQAPFGAPLNLGGNGGGLPPEMIQMIARTMMQNRLAGEGSPPINQPMLPMGA